MLEEQIIPFCEEVHDYFDDDVWEHMLKNNFLNQETYREWMHKMFDRTMDYDLDDNGVIFSYKELSREEVGKIISRAYRIYKMKG